MKFLAAIIAGSCFHSCPLGPDADPAPGGGLDPSVLLHPPLNRGRRTTAITRAGVSAP